VLSFRQIEARQKEFASLPQMARSTQSKSVCAQIADGTFSARRWAMVGIAYEQGQLILDTPEAQSAGGGSVNLHIMSPILIGLAAPFVLLYIVQPLAMAQVAFVATPVMLAVFVLSAGIYVHSVLSPGEIVAALFDPAGRTVTLVRAGRFGVSNREVHFSDIANIGMTVDYDNDGYPIRSAELRLLGGRIFRLPEGTEESHILSVREVLGLA
jgi:hypothetical protein